MRGDLLQVLQLRILRPYGVLKLPYPLFLTSNLLINIFHLHFEVMCELPLILQKALLLHYFSTSKVQVDLKPSDFFICTEHTLILPCNLSQVGKQVTKK
jgi:hypothetical protein